MAMMDRIRERMRGQQPVGAAAGMMPPAEEQRMPMGTQIQDIGRGMQQGPAMPGGGADDLDILTAPMSAEAQEAAQLGSRMGAQSILQMAGIGLKGGKGEREAGRLMNPQRLNEATMTLQNYQSGKNSIN